MARGETPISAHDRHAPKRDVIGQERAFYRGEDIVVDRGAETDADRRSRLYEDWYRTHQPRMPYFPVRASRRHTERRRNAETP